MQNHKYITINKFFFKKLEQNNFNVRKTETKLLVKNALRCYEISRILLFYFKGLNPNVNIFRFP